MGKYTTNWFITSLIMNTKIYLRIKLKTFLTNCLLVEMYNWYFLCLKQALNNYLFLNYIRYINIDV